MVSLDRDRDFDSQLGIEARRHRLARVTRGPVPREGHPAVWQRNVSAAFQLEISGKPYSRQRSLSGPHAPTAPAWILRTRLLEEGRDVKPSKSVGACSRRSAGWPVDRTRTWDLYLILAPSSVRTTSVSWPTSDRVEESPDLCEIKV